MQKTSKIVGYIDLLTQQLQADPPQGRPQTKMELPDGIPLAAVAKLQGVFDAYSGVLSKQFPTGYDGAQVIPPEVVATIPVVEVSIVKFAPEA